MRRVCSVKVSCLVVLLAFGVAGAAQAQINMVGDWAKAEGNQPVIGNSLLGDYLALPIRPEARQGGDSWSESRWTQLERGCTPYGVAGSFRGPALFRIAELRNATQDLIALQTYIATFSQSRTIWLDGRPHPPKNAAHTWQGFSTGTWNGNILTVNTTHIKQFWHRRNGIIASDRLVLTEQFIRHGDYLTWIMMADDPTYLTEPLVYSEIFRLNLNTAPDAFQTHLDCQPDEEIAGRAKGYVPHWLPGEKSFSQEIAGEYGLPVETVRGGAEMMYPDYIPTLKKLLATPGPAGASR